jgi:hypothetical protein
MEFYETLCFSNVPKFRDNTWLFFNTITIQEVLTSRRLLDVYIVIVKYYLHSCNNDFFNWRSEHFLNYI